MNAIVLVAALAVAPMPEVSGPVTSPGMMYPTPPVSIVPTATKVEDFPYITEEYLLSGTAAGAPYTTRIIVRRPKNPTGVQRDGRRRGAACRRALAHLRVVARVDPDAEPHVRGDRPQPRTTFSS